MSERNVDSSRRDFLRAAAGTATVTGATGTAAAAEDGGGGGGGNVQPQWPAYVSDAADNGYEDLRGQSEVSVGVYSNYFQPTFIWIEPETTITWEFEESGHNVKFNSQPDGSSLSGTSGGEFDVIDPGSTHTVTPTTGGIYTYYCGPHEGQGMKGAIAVGGDVPTEAVGGGGGGGPTLPENAKMLGIASGFAMVSTLGLAYFFMKYGGDYDEVDA
ncbi:plastocyanin/azurin family copper-binding protein [Halapricum salinum]|uniref:Halocyanin n=1 Tax=Halapricum salinum TaxID=1457250 RepID=A0A4D6HEE4_9EURY|nr:plastocyanin/azurin family copper-binding protein [Halapricum salinum]QCC51921.1 halocyanin [Halapricum salinum]